MADSVLSGIPPELRFPRPIIACAPESQAIRTAQIIADELYTAWGICEALGETIDPDRLVEFAVSCLAAKRNMIVVSHAPTIEALIGAMFSAKRISNQSLPINSLSRHQGIVLNTDAMTLGLVEALPVATNDA
jgi:broad specificity phosphatase PhoE